MIFVKYLNSILNITKLCQPPMVFQSNYYKVKMNDILIFSCHTFPCGEKSESLEASPWLGPLVSVRVNVQARLVDPPVLVFYFVSVYLYLCIFVILGVLVQVIIQTWLALVDHAAWKSFFSVETKLFLCFCPCYVVMKYLSLYSSVKFSLSV